ncbi:MAG: hypothetical protein HKN15_06565 [Xanthomonadales bacterium]|nr:hypothetical protein [Xanthomonadales bacterium]
MSRLLASLLVLLALSGPLLAQESEWEFSGDVGLELRYFADDALLPGQDDGFGASVALNFEAEWFGDNSRVSIEPFLRLDSVDSERSHFDLREAYWAYEGDGWEVLAGLNKVFWGVTESRHLVDIINQTDLVEDLDQEQKLGQPMIRGLLERDWGLFEIYVMPYFRERTFPGADGRLRTPLVVDTDAAVYESSADQHHTDIALRWSHYFGDVDIGVHAFHGTGREPRLLPYSSEGQAPVPTLIPFYHQVTQLGVDLQYTKDAWLWKLEAIGQHGFADDFFASVAGFEYTFYGINDGASDLGVLVEYLYDDRGPSEPITLFDDDVFVGARWALNDVQDTSVLAGVVFDNKESEWFFSLEAERRIGENYTAEARVRIFNGDPQGQLGFFDREDYVEVSLARYF